MQKKILSQLFTSLFFILFLDAAHAQLSSISPHRPSWKDSLRITYDPKDTAAVLSGKEEIYIRITRCFGDGHFESHHRLMRADNGVFKCLEPVQRECVYFDIQFYTLHKDDDGARIHGKIYQPGGQNLVSGAWLGDFFTGDSLEYRFKQEIGAYPTNFVPYGHYFNVVYLLKEPEESKKIITPYLAMLEKKYKAERRTGVQKRASPGGRPGPDPGLLFALTLGMSKTGDLAAARDYMLELLREYPGEYNTSLAFAHYTYALYKTYGKEELDSSVHAALKEVFLSHPLSPISYANGVAGYFLRGDSTIPVKAYEAVLLPAMQSGQLGIYDWGLMAQIWMERGVKMPEAKKLLEEEIERFVDGSVNQQQRVDGKKYRQFLPSLLLQLANVNLQCKEYDKAVVHSSAALELLAGSAIQGDLMPACEKVRAQAYRQAGNYGQAMEEYSVLYQSGDTTAEAIMRDMYPAIGGKKENFGSFLVSIRNQPSHDEGRADRGGKKIAPSFSARDMQGHWVSLDSFQHKTLVLNFWGTGCGPCIVEMPELNKLVEKYRNDPDVVFLAIAPDDSDRLKKFFLHRVFDYRILVEGESAFKAYGVEGMPQHVIIDREGMIAFRSMGQDPDIIPKLSRVIDRIR